MTHDGGPGTRVDDELAEIADAHGVAVSYRDGAQRLVQVDAEVVTDVLGLLEVDLSTPQARAEALAHARATASAGTLAPTIGMRTDRARPLPASPSPG